VIFDLDGTLLDTLDDIHEVVSRVFRAHGLRDRTREQVRLAVGRGVEHLVMKLTVDESLDNDGIRSLSENIRRVYMDMGSVMTRPYPGVTEVLENLMARGIPIAVLTNKPQSSADECVESYFPHIRFSMVRGVTDEGVLKPSVHASGPVLEALELPPHRVAMIGDSDVDMDTAMNAGMIPVGVSWGFRSTELLKAHGASVILRSPSDILRLLVDQGEEG
jgi:phosphoglycolate phosphatase